MVAGFSNPLAAVPYRQGPRSRQDEIAQALMKQGGSTASANKWQAFARVAQGLLGGYMSKLDQDDRSAADAALFKGYQGTPLQGELDAQMSPEEVRGYGGGTEGALFRLGELDPGNKYGTDLSRQLMGWEMAKDQSLRAANREFEQKKELATFTQGLKPEPLTFAEKLQLKQAGASRQNINIGGAASPLGKIAADLRVAVPGSAAAKALKTELKKQSLTVAQKKVDTEFAKEYTALIAGGGLADVQKNLAQLDEVVTALERGSDDLTGPFIGALPDWLKASFLPKATAIQDAVEEVVQRNLRLILGAQFTEREGMRLIARAYNPRLEEAENVKRIRRLRDAIEAAARAKFAAAKYYEEWGTLVDYKGSMRFSLSDIEAATVGDPTEVNLPEGVTNEDIQETMRVMNMTRQQVMDRLRETR